MMDLKSWPVTESGKQLARPTEKSLKLLVGVFLKTAINIFMHVMIERKTGLSMIRIEKSPGELYPRTWGLPANFVSS